LIGLNYLSYAFVDVHYIRPMNELRDDIEGAKSGQMTYTK